MFIKHIPSSSSRQFCQRLVAIKQDLNSQKSWHKTSHSTVLKVLTLIIPLLASDQYAQSQFTASQMSEYNAVNNPLWIAPYETWDEPR